ncbi:5'-3' exonuclease [Xylanibacillus composti]|uniref:5'-3' exonuclease n=1 Tax=Xylanibacillus composti TaxID=1572762 RepID=A0A8J4H723_9BACL|nr:5'-3' exonuclease H3TH domain-containing protein [Xylanibacillus composti]MDT9724689.1 5'-3' exonuclease [Xylanibacillus composti]GIQ70975.1 5'-3' exonuclease [Xylanibacillus composti]
MNETTENKQHLLIVDSFALLFRGFFAMAMSGNYMRNSSGLYTNGLYQFTKYMLHAIDTFKATHVACAFDMGAKTFRNERYPDYKANRAAPPEELVPQFDQLWELVEAFSIPCVGKAGYEADDVIGSLAKRYAAEGIQVTILTGDGDSLQLIQEDVQVAMMKKGFGNYEVIGLHNLQELKGIAHPSQVIEMKALMGDASDNIPGCPNVGPKTAQKLIAEFGSVEGVFANIGQIKGKLKDRLIENRELIHLSHELATIQVDVEIDCSLSACEYKIDVPKLLAKLEELEFKSFIRQFAAG